MEQDELPTIEETTKAIKQLKCGKAAGVDSVPPEIWKHGGPFCMSSIAHPGSMEDYQNISVIGHHCTVQEERGNILTVPITQGLSYLYRRKNPRGFC